MKYFRPKYKKWYFPTGEVGIKVLEFVSEGYMVLDYAEEKDIMGWLQIIDSYNRHAPYWSKDIFIPYFPYGRQDKLHKRGEAVSFDILVSILKSFGCIIHTMDNHCGEANRKILDISNIDLMKHADIFKHINFLCYPDKHARWHGVYKSLTYPRNIGHLHYKISIIMDKIRHPIIGSPQDGQVIECRIINKDEIPILDEYNILINDDICDGGLTFIEAAKTLENTLNNINSISLFVTHGLFTKGIMNLIDNGIDHIYTTNSYCKLKSNEYITVFDIFTGEIV